MRSFKLVPGALLRPLIVLIVLSTSASPAYGLPDAKTVQDNLNATAARYHEAEAHLAITQSRIEKLESDLARADEVIKSRSQAMRLRAASLYKLRFGPLVQSLLTAPSLGSFAKRIQLLQIVGDNDSKLVDGMQMTKARADRIRDELNSAKAQQKSLVLALRSRQRELESQLKGAQIGARVARFGNFGWFTLPIRGPSAFSNSWGDPRSGGRRHSGTDVMARCGAEVVAVTEGTIQDMHSGGAGGVMLWLRSGNGDIFFYAHLMKYAPGMSSGKKVGVGQLIAFNGNTGNARGGPCHVHFEWHPGGGRPVNPYPLLRAALG